MRPGVEDWFGDMLMPVWYALKYYKDLHPWGVVVKMWKPDEPEPGESSYGLWKSYPTRERAEQAARDLNERYRVGGRGAGFLCGYVWIFKGARLIKQPMP